MPLVPVLRHKYIRAWPKHEAGEPVEYVELAEALAREYPEDAHFACYSAPDILRRLDVSATKQRDVVMVAAVFDVDGPEHTCTPNWWADEQPKIDALLILHPLMVYQTRGGYRIVGTLANPESAANWKPYYKACVRYLARRFAIKADAVADWPRLFRLPHATRDGELQRHEVRGTPGVWAPELMPEDAEPLAKRDQRLLAVRMQSAPDLLRELFRARGWLGTENGEGVNVRCPRYHEHADGSPPPWDPADTSTTILPAEDGWRHGRLKCLHTGCGHAELTSKEWLACFSAQEILEATERLGSEWWSGLIQNAQGIMPCGANLAHALERHPDWAGKLTFDEFAGCTLLDGVALEDTDITAVAHWCARTLAFEPGADRTQAALELVARRNPVHPLRAYLEGLSWDQQPRLDRMLHVYFSAEDTPWTRAVSSRWMISAVARAFEPGCQADCMLVLESKQGTRKSTGLEALCPDKNWFSDSALPIGEKDAYVGLQRKWIYEVGELNAFKGRDVTWIKSFISARSDHYRPPYGRVAVDHPRQVVFAGTTNEAEYLEDRTGGRRFWPVACLGMVDTAAIERDRDQLWAEAVLRYARGESWYLDTAELNETAEAEQEARTVHDDWTGIIQVWLESETYWENNQKRTRPRDLSAGVTTAEVLVGALDFTPDRINKAATTRCGYCLRDLGMKKSKTNVGMCRTWRYFWPHNKSGAVQPVQPVQPISIESVKVP